MVILDEHIRHDAPERGAVADEPVVSITPPVRGESRGPRKNGLVRVDWAMPSRVGGVVDHGLGLNQQALPFPLQIHRQAELAVLLVDRILGDEPSRSVRPELVVPLGVVPAVAGCAESDAADSDVLPDEEARAQGDRKSTRLNSSHSQISY